MVKISEFKRQLKKEGVKFHRHGSRHDIYINPVNGRKSEVPRHDTQEIGTGLREKIWKQLGLK